MAQTNFATPGTFAGQTDMRSAVQRQMLSMAWDSCIAPMAAMHAAWTRRRQINRGIAELSDLSDHMLKDIGIERHDIERIVRYGRDATDLRA